MELSVTAEIAGTDERPRLDRAAGALIGSSCPVCDATSWPPRAICHRCGNPMNLSTPLAREGTLLSYTTVWVPRPGLETPYTLGQIEIADSVFFGHLRGSVEGLLVPSPVRLVMPAESEGALDFWFEPA
jgi:hypothetical protein